MAGTGTSAGVTSYETIENLKKSVKEKFTEIRKAVEIREKLLLRQIDVIANQTQLLSLSTIENIEFIPDNEKDLLQCLRGFGKFNLDNINFTNDLYYIQEDYILPSIDHETMHKRLDIIASKIADLNNDIHDNDNDNYDDDNNEQIIVNFSTNKKLIKDNVNNINESIIHITLNEAKEIIEKTKTNNLTTIIKNTTENNGNDIFNNYKDYEEDNKQQQQQEMIKDHHQQQERQEYEKQKRQSFITQSSQTDKKLKNIINPNITINNCNGTINLKNISNLTINCVRQDSFNIPDNSNKQSIESDNKTDDDDNDSSYQRNKQQQEESTESNDDRTGGSGTEQDQEQIEQISSYNNTSSDIQSSDTTNTTKDSENNSINNCEFYDRLISEIKYTLKQSQKAPVEHIPLGRKAFKEKFGGGGRGGGGHGGVAINDNYSNLATALSSSDSTTTTTTTTTNDSYNRKLLLKNFENLKVVLENNENDTHPVQIEQWLTEIISETEIEPMQNTDILEHSVINSTE